MESMKVKSVIGVGLWQSDDCSFRDIYNCKDTSEVPHSSQTVQLHEDDAVEQKLASCRKRYTTADMLLLRDKWTQKPAGWNVARDDGKQLACCSERAKFDWAASIKESTASALLARHALRSITGRVLNRPNARPSLQHGASASVQAVSSSSSSPTAVSSTNLQALVSESPASKYLLSSECPYSRSKTQATACSVQVPPKAADHAELSGRTGPTFSKYISSHAAHTCSTATRGEDAFFELISALVKLLDHSNTGSDTVAQAAGQLAAVCKDSAEGRHLARSAHAIPALLKLLRHNDVEVQENAVAAIWSLSIDNTENQELLVSSGVMPRLVRLLGTRSTTLQYVATATLLTLISDHTNHRDIAAEAGALPMLVHVLKSSRSLGKKVAAQTLAAVMSENTKNQVEVLRLGGVELLVNMLHAKGSQPDSQNAAIEALLALMSSHKHHDVVLAAGAKGHLQKILLSIGAKKAGQNSRVEASLRSKVMLALKKLSVDQHVASARMCIATPGRTCFADDTVGC